MITEAARAAVKRGAKHVDLFDDQWHWKIDTESLYLASCEDCIYGQLYGGYHAGLEETGVDPRDASQLGLSCVLANGRELTELWLEEIEARRDADIEAGFGTAKAEPAVCV